MTSILNCSNVLYNLFNDSYESINKELYNYLNSIK